MSRERILEVVLTMLGAVLLLIAAAGKHPYGFYMVLRLVITVGAVYWAWRVYKAGLRAWTWMFVAVALLLNPFLPIHMQRAQWQPIDLCLGILLIGWSGYWLLRAGTDQRKQPVITLEKSRVTKLAAVRRVVTVVSIAVALVVGVNVLWWTGEAFREHSGLFFSLLGTMVLATGALARFVGKLPYRSKVKVVWLGLVCYLSFTSLFSFDVVRDKFGQRFVPGYYSYYDDCEDATPDNPCSLFPTYRVNGHLSPTIEGVMLLYAVACIACPWAAYRLWQAAQVKLEKEYPFEEELSQDEPKPGDPKPGDPEYEMLKAKLLRLQAELGVSDTPKI
jgi:hypothetical protein